jgi:hypothetical protein
MGGKRVLIFLRLRKTLPSRLAHDCSLRARPFLAIRARFPESFAGPPQTPLLV